jgi:NAD(P)H-nitrite reductase large subunit
MRHLILGNGAAGIAASRKLRELRGEDEILIISDEPYPTYSRCLLAEYVAGTIPKEKLFIYPEEFYREQGFELMLDVRAVGIDVHERKVRLKNGESLGFDRLLIATGARPAPPPIPGIENRRVVGLRDISDAERIIELTSRSFECAVIGGGYIGLEVAYALRRRGLKVCVLEMMPHILYANFDEISSRIIAEDLKGEGIAIRTGEDGHVIGIEGLNDGLALTLKSGERIEVDFAVHATGVRPNVDVISGTPIRVGAGVLVDEHLQSNVEGIYAAGDVAQARDLLTGELKTTPIWPNAVAQGKLAAYNMAGIERIYTGEVGLQNAVEFRRVPAIAFGMSKATEAEGYEVMKLHRPADGIYKKVVLQGDVVKGMIFVGDISDAGIVASLIKGSRHLGELKGKILDETFSMAYLIEERRPTSDLYFKENTD